MLNSKLETRRLESAKSYIEALSKKYSKLLIVRVDLSYSKSCSNDIALTQANKNINHMLSNRRNNKTVFENNIGHMIKKEHTKDKGVHNHCLFLYDGQKVQNGSFKADQIGKYWSETVTKGNGIFHNCHKNKYDKNGIGILDYSDTQKREILDNNVISYLCKDTQSVDSLKQSKKDKAFVRGAMPKGKAKTGRPRKSNKQHI